MIKKEIIEKIRYSKTCKARLQLALNKNASTIEKWLAGKANYIMLTTDAALNVISAEFDIPKPEIIDTETVANN